MASLRGFGYNCDPETGRKDTHEMLYCADKDFNIADTALNKNHQELRQVLSPKGTTALMASEELWLKLRDTNCHFEGLLYDGGTLQNVVEIQCRAEETEKRNQWLIQQIKNRSN
jgi:uncharacterized protein YecT (DUF1311 family)